MKSSQLQSLLMRNANRITEIENTITYMKFNIIELGELSGGGKDLIYKVIGKYRNEIKALAKLQVALKQELKAVCECAYYDDLNYWFEMQL